MKNESRNPNSSVVQVSSWKQFGPRGAPPPRPILLVQAGAAASGLTLVEAAHVFIMEPMMRQEEELQAHARCHRYGQKRPVSVRTYFAPVTVESRMLGLRADVMQLERERARKDASIMQETEAAEALRDSDEEEKDDDSEDEGDEDEIEGMGEAAGDGEDDDVVQGERARLEARRQLYVCGLVNTI